MCNALNQAERVLLPYEITLFSNRHMYDYLIHEFYYLMKLHYSQTSSGTETEDNSFYYLMKLHYSQTKRSSC